MNNAFTGSEAARLEEIQNYWLVFEPMSDELYALTNKLYTVPQGQTVKPEFIINSGSYSSTSGSIDIEKIIHIFEDETEATNFITDIGPQNIVSAIQRNERRGSTTVRVTEVHVVNCPQLDLSFFYRDANYDNGFFLNVFESGSVLKEVFDHEIYDKSGRLVSDTYLKYFKIQGDKE